MASSIVLDSSVILASIFAEPLSVKARALRHFCVRKQLQFAAPALLQYELVSVVRKNVYRGLFTSQEAQHGLTILINMMASVQFLIDEPLLKRAYELAEQFNRPSAYDAQYLAVAERLGCEFWTADERLFNAVSGQLRWVNWLKNFDENLAKPRP